MLKIKQIKEFGTSPWASEDWKILQYDDTLWRYTHVDVWTSISNDYTLSNVIENRTLDANDTSLDEVADILWTAINDMKAYALTWSSNETYTEENVTTSRSLNANSVSVEQLADVLWTLLTDLRSKWIIN